MRGLHVIKYDAGDGLQAFKTKTFTLVMFKTQRGGEAQYNSLHVPSDDPALVYVLMALQCHLDEKGHDLPEDVLLGDVVVQNKEELFEKYGPPPTSFEELRERVGVDHPDFVAAVLS